MKRQVLLLSVLLVVVGVGSASAEMSPMTLVSNIPFGFDVGGQTLPQGEYTIRTSSFDKVLQLSDGKGHSSYIRIMRLSNEVGAPKNKLVFHLVNGQYFLVSVWMPNNSGRFLFPSSREKELLAHSDQPAVRELIATTR